MGHSYNSLLMDRIKTDAKELGYKNLPGAE